MLTRRLVWTVFSLAFAARGAPAKVEDPSFAWLCGEQSNEQSCPCKDRVVDFPGWTDRQPLPSPWFSGYLEYEFQGRTVNTHYVLVMAEQDNAQKYDDKPLIYWSNGGPGASSLFGLLSELGPLLFSDLSKQTEDFRETGIPTPIYNQFNWAKLGHLLIFDQPAPIGFSFCEPSNATSPDDELINSPKDDVPSCEGLSWTDELASANSYAAMLAFHAKFPKFIGRDLFLTGESYAGIYIPTLAREILNGNKQIQHTNSTPLALKGFAVGDGCLGTDTGICQVLDDSGDGFDFWLVLFLAGHNQIPLQLFQQVWRACKPFSDHHEEFKGTDICKAAVAKVRAAAGGVYDYSLYDECVYEKSNPMSKLAMSGDRQGLQGALNDYPCGGDQVMEEYLQLGVVQEAFHVQDADYYSVDNANGFDYTPTEKDLSAFYKHVALETNLSVLVYNGDVDPAITSFAAQNWTSHLGLHTKEEWGPWTVDGCRRMGGYVTRYQGDLDFLTIRGAGHMVPTYKAAASFTFLQSWLRGEEYPPYVANCTSPSASFDIGEGDPQKAQTQPAFLRAVA
mmetsp:Transcript_10790/g.29802  ORF Transcript_10790/g.29802 Transcript_10790/m.29802 type:complete len:564 (+) Transcript_10790:58-1749(+)